MNNRVVKSMKTNTFFGLVAALLLPAFAGWAQPPAPSAGAPAPSENAGPPAAVSPAVAEVIRLAQSGVGEDVVTGYIQNSAAPFDLSADQILYLRDLGISSQAITAMLGRDATLRAQGGPPPGAAQPAPEPAPVP